MIFISIEKNNALFYFSVFEYFFWIIPVVLAKSYIYIDTLLSLC